MIEPLALLIYQKLLPGSQLKNRLEDLGYRVQTLPDPALLVELAAEARPLVVLADLDCNPGQLLAAISQLRQRPDTSHIPVIAFSAQADAGQKATAAGATLVASESAVLSQLPQLLDQALQVE